MEKEAFSYLIVSPNEISSADIANLEEVTQQFPYCQLAHALLSKGHFEVMNNELATEKLRHAAAYALSRNALRKLMNGDFKNETTAVNFSSKGYTHYLKSLNSESKPTDNQNIPLEINPLQALRGIDYSETLLSNETQKMADKGITLPTEDLRKNQSDLIEKFIQTEPRIRPLKAKAGENLPEPTEDLVEQTLPVAIKLVTESFAKIQAKQGKFDKAIEIYEQLILKNPEKKAYFAEKIEDLRQDKQ